MFEKFLKSAHSERGSSMIEALLATTIMGGAIFAGVFQINVANRPIANSEKRRNIHTIEQSIMDVFQRSDAVRYSVMRSNDESIRECYLDSRKSCQNKAKMPIALYFFGTNRKITGTVKEPVFYDELGRQCAESDKLCHVYKVFTVLRPLCSPNQNVCNTPFHSVLKYFITTPSLASGKDRVVAQGELEQPSIYKKKYDLDRINLECPDGAIVSGIGLDESAICTRLSLIEYVDGKPEESKTVDIKPGECQLPATNSTVPLAATQKKEVPFIASINENTGEISCGIKKVK